MARGFAVGGSAAEELFACAALGRAGLGVEGVVGRGHFDGAPPMKALALDAGFGSQESAHDPIWVAGRGDPHLDLSRAFRATDDLLFGDEIGMSFEPLVMQRLLVFEVLEAGGCVSVNSAESVECGDGASGCSPDASLTIRRLL